MTAWWRCPPESWCVSVVAARPSFEGGWWYWHDVDSRLRGFTLEPKQSRPYDAIDEDARGQSKLSEDRAECGEAHKLPFNTTSGPCRALRSCRGLLRVRTELTRLVRKRGVLC